MRPLRTKCICVGVLLQALAQRDLHECGCWVGLVLEVGVMVAVCLWKILAADINGMFWYDVKHLSKFEASSRMKLGECML